tara:strand:- start:223 stop:711 length:489 start_codon:yes stop_codon:yes gene_type:complete
MIKVYDNFLSEKEKQEIYDFCKKQSYHRGEVDRIGLPPTGLICNLDNQNIISKLMKQVTNEKKDMFRTYINLFTPNENPYFHMDKTSPYYKTCIYYVNTEKINYMDEGGETYFIQPDFIKGVSFVPGRMVFFNANIMHKATPFRNRDRYTIAIKYKDDNIGK